MMTTDSPWRTLGRIPQQAWLDELRRVDSPMLSEWDTVLDAAGDHSFLMAAMLAVESQYGTAFNLNVPGNRNPLNLRPPEGNGYLRFPSYVDCVRAWAERITSATYKGGIYARTQTIRELVDVYAPSFDNNNPGQYASLIVAKHSAIFGAGRTETMATPQTIDYSPLPCPVTGDIISESQPNQNPGIAMTPKSGTWHETANESVGADSLMHGTYLRNGGGGQQISWHFTVDDKRIVQHIPLNRVAWHAGDGGGPGNMTSIAVECCVNQDGDLRRAQEHQAALFGLLRARGIIADVVQHNHWSGKNCPTKIRNGVGGFTWADAQTLIRSYAEQYGSPPAPTPVEPSPIWWKVGDIGIQKRAHDGALAMAMVGEVTAKRNVPIRKDAYSKAAVVARMKAGDKARIVGTYRGSNRWVFVEIAPGKYGRALWSAFVERYPTI